MKNTATIKKNALFNGIEIYFDGKPGADVIARLKEDLRARWHSVKKCWYFKDTPENARTAAEIVGQADAHAQSDTTTHAQKNAPKKPALASLWERTRTDGLYAYGGSNPMIEEMHNLARTEKPYKSFDRRAAEYMRKHLRARFPECKWSVTSGGAGYLDSVNISLISSPYARTETADEDGRKYPVNTPELDAVIKYAQKLHDSFDYDDGDVYADYGAHHNLYGHASIDWQYKQSEPTDAQKKDAEDFRASLAQYEEQQREESRKRWEAEEKARELERIESEKKDKEADELAQRIIDAVKVVDLSPADAFVVKDMHGEICKAYTLTEAQNEADAQALENRVTFGDVEVNRKVIFPDSEDGRILFLHFCENSRLFARDWDFYRGKGCTRTVDERIPDDMSLTKLNARQRATVHFFTADAVAVYLGDVLQFVVDPQGYSYARYIWFMPEISDIDDIVNAEEYEREHAEKSKTQAPFHFPQPVAQQAEASGLEYGDDVTIIAQNDWTGIASETHAKIYELDKCDYAQYKNAVKLTYASAHKRTSTTDYYHDGRALVVYRGHLPEVPDTIKYTNAGEHLQQVNYAGSNATDYIINVIEYYSAQGFTPVIDTIQR